MRSTCRTRRVRSATRTAASSPGGRATTSDDADVRLTRSVDVPSGSDVRFWSWNNYTIEEFWDYGFIEVSTDDGATWEQLVVRDEAGNEVSTDEDPNGNLEAYFGGMENGLTGTPAATATTGST